MNSIKKIIFIINSEGIKGLIWRIKRIILPNIHSKVFQNHKSKFENKIALEIGGPSALFRNTNIFPIYDSLLNVDGCNFSTNTIWEGKIKGGVNNYSYTNFKSGTQFVNEGSDLNTISNNQYDLILSCHSLEHIANPIKALKEWMRVLKPNGYILIILPNPIYTFDHKRPISKLDHLINDYLNEIDERDLTCLEEIIEFHDMQRDPSGPNTFLELKERSMKNYENRCLHHHVFNMELIKEIFEYLNIKIIEQEFIRPCNLITLGQKKS
jgi:SAM-dependent methyltransferase